MKLPRLILLICCLLFVLAIGAIWWDWPRSVDMANYAPGDALIYVEVNSLADVAEAMSDSVALKSLLPQLAANQSRRNRLGFWAARAGMGPAQSVIFTRAQMALVVLDIARQETDDSIRVRPEAALIVETHTPRWRMKSIAVEDLKRLARFAYGTTGCAERTTNGDYIECTEAGGLRKIVAAINGTTLVIGNSEKAVESCLAAKRGQRPNLSTDPEFQSTRTQLKKESSLAFGYVSQSNTAKLVSLGVPLLFRKAPGDSQFESLLSTNAAKILRGIAWTSNQSAGMVEEHYQITLDPSVVARLQPAFQVAREDDEAAWQFVPAAFRAITVYHSNDLQAAWSSLSSALSMKLDAVSSVLISELLKASLASYGVENPREFLAGMTAPVMTIRPALGEESLLLGRVKDERQLRKSLAALIDQGKGQVLNGPEERPNRAKEFTALFVSGFLVMGKTENLLVYLDQIRNKETITNELAQSLGLSQHPDSAIVTFTSEREAVRSAVLALSSLKGQTLSDQDLLRIESSPAANNVSCTESRLNESGIDRRTRSAFGQFGNLLSLAVADSSRSNGK